MSQPSRALYLFLNVTKIPFEPKPIKLDRGEQLKESYGEVNPFRKVPAIDDNGFKLSESVAMLRYLAREKAVDDHWYPRDLKSQAKVDEYLEWQHVNTRLFCAMFFQHKFSKPMLLKTPVNEKAVTRFHDGMVNCLHEIEHIWLNGDKKPFLCGDNITIADLLACCELEQPGMAGYDVFTKHPILGQYRDRVRDATGKHYEDAHKVVRIVTRKYGGVPPTDFKSK